MLWLFHTDLRPHRQLLMLFHNHTHLMLFIHNKLLLLFQNYKQLLFQLFPLPF